MNRIKWYIKKIHKMDYKAFLKVVKEISSITGHTKTYILFDIFLCAIIYGAGYVDYYEYEFYLMNHKQRRTYLTININEQMIRKYNNKDHTYKFHDKGVFNKIFDKYLGREWINLEVSNKDDFKKFIKNKKKIIVKPNRECSGKGIEIININKKTNFDKLYTKLKRNKQCVVEEVIENHGDIRKIYSKSLNTLRIISFTREKEVYILAQALKIGNGGILDNFAAGGMYTFIDDKGMVFAPAIDKNGKTYDIHPITKIKFIGLVIPYYHEAINLVKEASLIVPEVPYVGWDIAITNDGPVIIEGNPVSGIFQLKASLNPNKIGALPKYNEAMHFFKNKKF